ncbi:hypothetical protein ACFL1R_03985 [Candidatus Latescibacterota bacterium]
MSVFKLDKVFGWKILQYFILGLVFALIADIPSSFNTIYLLAKVILYSLLFATLLLSTRRALVFLLMIAVVGQDIIQTGTEVESGAFYMSSIWQGQIGPLRPSWIIMVYCLLLLFKSPIFFRDRPVIYASLWFVTVPIITCFLYGGFTTEFASTHIVIDLKFPLMLITSLLIYRSYLKTHPDFISTLSAVFVGGILARHFIYFFYWLNGIGSIYAGINRVSVDSTKGTVVILFLLSVYLLLVRKRLLWGGLMGAFSGLLIIVYTTRMIWLTTVIGIFCIIFTMRLSRWILVISITAAIVFGSFAMLARLAPENIILAVLKANRFSSGVTKDNFLEQLDPPRYAELLNFFDTNMKRYAILWGSGYGSYYTESARQFPRRMLNAFPDYSFASGQFFTCHNYVFLMLFKHGILGLLIISCLWLIPGFRCFKILRKLPSTSFSIVYSSMVVFLPTSILTMYWSGKGVIISGFLISFYLTFFEYCSSQLILSKSSATAPESEYDAMKNNTAQIQ